VAGVTPTIRVLIVDDDALVRAAISMMLAAADGIDVVAEAGDGDEVGTAVDAHQPHVVLMDIRMPRVDGIEATARLRRRPGGPRADDLRGRRTGAASTARRGQRLPAQGHAAGTDRRRRAQDRRR
jgi:CheY-like chemotaxis protein